MSSTYFLIDPDNGQLRFTTAGRKALGERFARAGIDLRQIKTLDQAQDAARTVSHLEMRLLAVEMKGKDPMIDKAMTGLPEWDH